MSQFSQVHEKLVGVRTTRPLGSGELKLSTDVADLQRLVTTLAAKSYLKDFHSKCEALLMRQSVRSSESPGLRRELSSTMQLTTRSMGFVKSILKPLLGNSNTILEPLVYRIAERDGAKFMHLSRSVDSLRDKKKLFLPFCTRSHYCSCLLSVL